MMQIASICKGLTEASEFLRFNKGSKYTAIYLDSAGMPSAQRSI